MKWSNTKFCKKELGTFLSTGRGSAENFCREAAPWAMSLSISSYTGPRALSPKEVTRWLYWLVTGTMESAPNSSP